jgi:hypothetical protein
MSFRGLSRARFAGRSGKVSSSTYFAGLDIEYGGGITCENTPNDGAINPLPAVSEADAVGEG